MIKEKQISSSINYRNGNLEFCWSETNQSYEICQFLHPPKEAKIVIVFYKRNEEGYEVQFVGDRHADLFIIATVIPTNCRDSTN